MWIIFLVNVTRFYFTTLLCIFLREFILNFFMGSDGRENTERARRIFHQQNFFYIFYVICFVPLWLRKIARNILKVIALMNEERNDKIFTGNWHRFHFQCFDFCTAAHNWTVNHRNRFSWYFNTLLLISLFETSIIAYLKGFQHNIFLSNRFNLWTIHNFSLKYIFANPRTTLN